MPRLIIVPTPIGNLEDITLRAIKALRECDAILAEDTRTTGNLLKHLDISRPLHSYHKFNEHKMLGRLIALIQSSKTVCLVSDAGTPGISDPGFLLLREAIRHNISVETLPGATAFVPALVNSGFPVDRFCFEGFLPVKKGRQTRLMAIAKETRTTVLYESPHRLLKLLHGFSEILEPERQISVSRELTKIYEETIRGNPKELIEYFQKHTLKGEIVVVVEGFSAKTNKGNDTTE